MTLIITLLLPNPGPFLELKSSSSIQKAFDLCGSPHNSNPRAFRWAVSFFLLILISLGRGTFFWVQNLAIIGPPRLGGRSLASDCFLLPLKLPPSPDPCFYKCGWPTTPTSFQRRPACVGRRTADRERDVQACGAPVQHSHATQGHCRHPRDHGPGICRGVVFTFFPSKFLLNKNI